MHAIHTTHHPIATLLCLGALASAHAQSISNAALPSGVAVAEPLRFGAPNLRRYEDIAGLPVGTLITGPNGARVTAAQVRQQRQAKLTHRAAAKAGRLVVRQAAKAAPIISPRVARVLAAAGVGQPPRIVFVSYCQDDQQTPVLNGDDPGGCDTLTLRVPGATRIDAAMLSPQFGEALVNFEVPPLGADGTLKLRLPATHHTGFSCKTAPNRQPSQNATLVLRTNHPSQTQIAAPLCFIPQLTRTPVALPTSVLSAAASDPAATIETQGNLLTVRRHAELAQPYGGEWNPAHSPSLICLAPGTDTLTLPHRNQSSQFRWIVELSTGRTDTGAGDAAGGPGSRSVHGVYGLGWNGGVFAVDMAGGPVKVTWAVWESLHEGPPPEGDDKVCLSLYGLSFYLEGPVGLPAPVQ